MQIRYAKRCDLGDIQQLVECHRETKVEKEKLEEIFECMENDLSYHMLVATKEDRIVGLGIGLVKYCFIHGEKMNIENTFVRHIDEASRIKEKLEESLNQVANGQLLLCI